MIDGKAGWPTDARHCLRLGAMNDKAVVEAAQGTFDVVVLQANLVVSMKRGLGSWTGLQKPFWIDPIAYAYAASTEYLKSEQKAKPGEAQPPRTFKKTFVQLSEQYGDPFTRVIQRDRQLQPADFDPAGDTAVVSRILQWQKDALSPPPEDLKYLPSPSLEPVLLTVPYFPLEPFTATAGAPRWLDVNLRFVGCALELRIVPPERLAVSVLVEDALFDHPELFDPIWEQYLSLPIRNIWLWISDNDEVADMTASRAAYLRAIVRRASGRGKAVHQAFGGSFSTFLLADGLMSVAHGVGYWEHKNWEPLAPGGMPTLRFFYPPLRRRLPFLEADQSLPPSLESAEDFFQHVCGCPTCRLVLAEGLSEFRRYGEVNRRSRTDRFGNRIDYDVPTPEALIRSKLHYLRARAIEVDDALSPEFDPRVVLDRAVRDYVGRFVSVKSLENWRHGFNELG